MDTGVLADIKAELAEIERQENVRILYCAESGSRAWGFASPDSDYDVRFIYVRPVQEYLRLWKTRDVIEWKLDDTLDINGWDIKKALQLLETSNPTLFEWNGSPIVYRSSGEWERISSIIDRYFRSKHGLYHYLHTAQRNYREYLKGEEVKLKKYFYVLRPLLACRYILRNNTPPPMLFSELAETQLEPALRPVVDELVRAKMQQPEIGTGKRIDVLNEYIDRSLTEIEALLSEMLDEPPGDRDELERLFADIVLTEK